jgi:hypothetical protein
LTIGCCATPKEALEAARGEGLAVDASCVGEAAVRLRIRSHRRVRKTID